jgi:microfibrillar-associated protein 1
MLRLKRDVEGREKILVEKADLLRRRNMTEEERIIEDNKLGRFDKKEKSKWNYMQKYYHKGKYYVDFFIY